MSLKYESTQDFEGEGNIVIHIWKPKCVISEEKNDEQEKLSIDQIKRFTSGDDCKGGSVDKHAKIYTSGEYKSSNTFTLRSVVEDKLPIIGFNTKEIEYNTDDEDIPDLIAHIIPEWNESKSEQVRSRVLREESHSSFKLSEVLDKECEIIGERIASESLKDDNPLAVLSNGGSIGSTVNTDRIIGFLDKQYIIKSNGLSNNNIVDWEKNNPQSKVLQECEIPEKDIDLVMDQAQCSRKFAIEALVNYDGDIVNAIMELTM